MRPSLSDEQVVAATTRYRRAFVEAGPGAGKTTVAAERFGVVRFSRATGADRGVVALSFTHAASQELRRRVVDRWSPRVLDGTSRVGTIDAELVRIVCYLLRTGNIRWPGGHILLDPLDTWRGHPKYKWQRNQRWGCYMPGLDGREVAPVKVRDVAWGFGKTDLALELAAGLCTHDDIRGLLAIALRDPDLRQVIAHHRQATVAHLIVDEVFDADALDLDLVRLHCDADIPVTVIGDRWQALYEFRNAQPKKVRETLDSLDFKVFPVLTSYRFKSAQTRQLGSALRDRRHPIPRLPDVSTADVVIAPWWRQLWAAPTWVLPISFGAVAHQTDAVMSLLLDHVLRKRLDTPARSRREALVTLGMAHDIDATWPDVFEPVEQMLKDRSPGATAAALAVLRDTPLQLGRQRPVRRLQDESKERKATARLASLARRVNHTGSFVIGLSAHQAKGKEWDRVGVCLSPEHITDLAAGLSLDDETHRKLYVALTRGCRLTGRVSSDTTSAPPDRP